MMIISRGGEGGTDIAQPLRDVSSDGAEKLLRHNASDAGEVNRAEYGVKTVVVSRMNACRQAHGQASLTSNNSTGARSFFRLEPLFSHEHSHE